jgi:aminoglycoside phosphotransferase (APT) family kinase protein
MVRNMPRADVDVDADLVGRLLREQRPDLAALPRSALANGWDNVLVRLGTDLLARLPRRATAASLVEHEQKWLPVLARGLPLPVPVPVFVGRPGCGYAWSWSVVPFLQGRAARVQDLNAPAGAALGGFLGALHRPAPAEAPANPVRGVPLLAREAAFLDNLRLVTDARLLSTAAAALDVWHMAVSAAQFAGPPVWLHGDLHPSNVLVDDGRVCGVIDFGDLTAGDPATDLASSWMLADVPARTAFWSAYESTVGHEVDEALRVRARGWALHLALAFLAHSADNPVIHAIGVHTLSAVFSS